MKRRRSASRFASLITRRESRQRLRLILQRAVALGMAALLLPLAQIDALAQDQVTPPTKPSPYHYAQPDTDSAQQQPMSPQPPKAHAQSPLRQPQKPVFQAQAQYPPQPAFQAQQQYPEPAYQPQPYSEQQYPQQPAYAAQPYGQAQPVYPQQPRYPTQPSPNPNPYYAQGQPAYPAQPYPQPQYQQEAPAPQDYAGQGSYPDQSSSPQSPAVNQQPDQGFASQQLEQLVAPIALYPDALVAQILAASTYPAQVAAADHWRQSMGRVSPDEVAAAADAQSTWDPSIKALTAFPQVLAMMDRDLQWTTDLGNAYYNQPQDVLNTIQVLRQRAENAGTLRSTPQQAVTSDQGYIELAPTNPQVVYVPTYNPWYAYGAPIYPYPGFCFVDAFGHAIAAVGAGLVFGVGIALGAFFRAAFGWLGWGLNWHAGGISYRHAPYYSRSTSVAHWGGSRGEYHGANGGNFAGGRTAPSRPSRPMPLGRDSAGNYAGNARAESGYGRAANPDANLRYGQSERDLQSQLSARGAATSTYRGSEGLSRLPAQGYAGNRAENYAYARPAEPMRQQFSAPQQFGRPQSYTNPGYNSGGYRGQQSFANERAYAAPGPALGGYREPRNESYGGSHFGGGHSESYHAPKAPSYHAPKMSGGGHSGGGLFHHSGGGGGKHH
jgi:hypothetical protein